MNIGTRSRVVVWLDPTAAQDDVLQVLSGLGSAAEVLGLFIEDTNLLDLSSLSVAREFTIEGATVRQLDKRNIERQFRANAARMRAAFEKAAQATSARRSFRVARGELASELLKLSTECDTLVVAHSRRNFGPRLTIRTQLNELLLCGPRTLIFVQEQWRTGERVVVLFDGTPSGKAALRTAEMISGSEGLALSVLLPTTSEENRRELEAQIAEELNRNADHTLIVLSTDDIDELVRAADSEHARVMVLPDSEPTVTYRRIAELLDRVNCSLIVTR